MNLNRWRASRAAYVWVGRWMLGIAVGFIALVILLALVAQPADASISDRLTREAYESAPRLDTRPAPSGTCDRLNGRAYTIRNLGVTL